MMKTYSVKQSDIKRETHVIDAADKILGRVATEIAKLLMGKHKVMFSRNSDLGDNVTVINAAASNAMNCFPASGDAINALSANTALSIIANKTVMFVCAVNGIWNSIVTA